MTRGEEESGTSLLPFFSLLCPVDRVLHCAMSHSDSCDGTCHVRLFRCVWAISAISTLSEDRVDVNGTRHERTRGVFLGPSERRIGRLT